MAASSKALSCGALGCEPGDAPDRLSDLTATSRYASKSCFLRPKGRSAGCAPSSERTSTSRCSTSTRPPESGSHRRSSRSILGSASRDGAATGLVQRAAAALINAELVELGYVPAASSVRLRRIVYMIIGYTFFLVSLPRRLGDLFRHFARSCGARRAARSVTRQSVGRKLPGGTLPRQAAMPAPADAL